MLRDPDLPDALHALEGDYAPAYARTQEDRAKRLEDLGKVIAEKRDAAVAARKESGIEAIWIAAEEAYLGIDDVNRNEVTGSRWVKSTSPVGPITRERNPKVGNKSTVFVPLTCRYVDMAFAKVSGIVLPIDDRPFSIKPSPIPDLAGKLADTTPVTTPGGQQVAQGDLLKQAVAVATARAQKESDWIYDNWVEAKYPREMRKVLFDAARIGTGVLKGPVPTVRREQSFSVVDGVGQLKVEKKIAPGLQSMSVWDVFPAPGCGEEINNGDHIFDREFFTEKKLKGLKELKDQFDRPMYLPDQIDKVIEEGPGKVNHDSDDTARPGKQDHKNHYELFRFYGELTKQNMLDMGVDGKDLPDDIVAVYAIVEMVNDTVIRASVNPLDKSGAFPHKIVRWQRRAGHWSGVGVGERVDVPQRMINSSTRAMLNNAGKSAGSQIVMDRRAITPVDGSWDLNTGDKLWDLTGEQLVDDVRKIFLTYNVPNLTPQMLTIIEFALKLAEECTNLPLISQGQAGKDDPDTFGQSELQNNNANELLRSIAWSIDDDCTEPLVQEHHEWYLLDPDVPDQDKGDFEINANGSIAMVERAIQEQTYAQLLPLSENPMWGQDPKKLFAQYLRIKRLNPDDTAYSPEDLARIQSTPPPPAPAVQAAQINAATKLHVTEMQGDQRLQEIQAEAAHDQAQLVAGGTTPHEAMAQARIADSQIRAETARYVEDSRATAEGARAEKELEVAKTDGYYRMRELEMQRDVLILTYAQKQNLTLMQVKGDLANTALQARVQQQLKGADQAFQSSENVLDRQHEVSQGAVDRQHQAQQNEADRTHEMDKHESSIEADAQAAKLAADAAKAAAKAKPAKPAAKKAAKK